MFTEKIFCIFESAKRKSDEEIFYQAKQQARTYL